MREILLKALELPQAERYRLAFLIAESLGYALRNNEEAIEMTKQQEETIYQAYLGICLLRKCAVKWGQDSEIEKADKLLIQMGEAFPLIPARVAGAVLRS